MGQLKNAQQEKKDAQRAAARSKAQADGWRGFVNVELTKDQKAEAARLMDDGARLWDNIFGLVYSGYKLTLSYDADRSAYNLSCTCREAGDPNNGYTLSGRGGSEIAAAASFWYKHAEVCGGRWPTAEANTGRTFSPGDLD